MTSPEPVTAAQERVGQVGKAIPSEPSSNGHHGAGNGSKPPPADPPRREGGRGRPDRPDRWKVVLLWGLELGAMIFLAFLAGWSWARTLERRPKAEVEG
jgi:hypothetical protein